MKAYTTRAGNIRNIVLGFSIPLLLFIMLFVNGLINGEQMSTGTFMWIYGGALIMAVIAMTLFVYGASTRKTNWFSTSGKERAGTLQ